MGGRGAVNGDASGEIGLGNGHLDLADAAAKAAALMGAERDNLLAGEIIALQECENSHRRHAPPIGIAEDDGVVLIHVLHRSGKFRTGLSAKLLLSLLDANHIIVGIFPHSFDPEDIGLRKLGLNLLNDNLLVAFGKEADAAVHPVFSTAGEECDKCLCHNRD